VRPEGIIGDVPAPAPYLHALRGDARGFADWVRSHPEHPWSKAGGNLLALADPKSFEAASLDALPRDPEASLDAIVVAAHRAILELDARLLVSLEDRLPHTSRGVAWRRALGAYRHLLAGDVDAVMASSAEVGSTAQEHGWALLRIHGVLLEALAHVLRRDLPRATSSARRASRMAQTERLWMAHYLCGAILARVRRTNGQPHLAQLIASACVEAAPVSYLGWLAWELLFAGAELPELAGGSLLGDAAEALFGALQTGVLPDVSALTARLGGSPHGLDLSALSTLLGSGDDAETREWLHGLRVDSPVALHGVLRPQWARGVTVLALGTPDRRGRRCVAYARPEGHVALSPKGSRPGRPEAIAAALVLAPADGIDRATLFTQAYGFGYRRRLHEASFKVARHEAKKLLSDCAAIQTEGDRLRLEILRPFAVPDPRCEEPLQDRMLRSLAARRGASARELAEHLGVSVRTVQAALQEMKEEGVCVARKLGRRVAYEVEDTTFCELTLV